VDYIIIQYCISDGLVTLCSKLSIHESWREGIGLDQGCELADPLLKALGSINENAELSQGLNLLLRVRIHKVQFQNCFGHQQFLFCYVTFESHSAVHNWPSVVRVWPA
jgi:hypothetical protein